MLLISVVWTWLYGMNLTPCAHLFLIRTVGLAEGQEHEIPDNCSSIKLMHIWISWWIIDMTDVTSTSSLLQAARCPRLRPLIEIITVTKRFLCFVHYFINCWHKPSQPNRVYKPVFTGTLSSTSVKSKIGSTLYKWTRWHNCWKIPIALKERNQNINKHNKSF